MATLRFLFLPPFSLSRRCSVPPLLPFQFIIARTKGGSQEGRYEIGEDRRTKEHPSIHSFTAQHAAGYRAGRPVCRRKVFSTGIPSLYVPLSLKGQLPPRMSLIVPYRTQRRPFAMNLKQIGVSRPEKALSSVI